MSHGHMSSALAGWVVQNLWLHYKYYPDNDLLKNELYQPLKEVALFYLDFLSQCDKGKDGKAIIGPSYSPEHGHYGIYQGTADITFMRMMFNIMIECRFGTESRSGICRTMLLKL